MCSGEAGSSSFLRWPRAQLAVPSYAGAAILVTANKGTSGAEPQSTRVQAGHSLGPLTKTRIVSTIEEV